MQISETRQSQENMRTYKITVPKRYAGARVTPADYGPEVEGWIKDPKDFLFIYGETGCGKTYLASAVCQDLGARGIKCGFEVGAEVFLKLRKSFDRDSLQSEWEIIKKYRSAVVGVFDDVGATGCRDYVLESWYNIINHRYNECIPTMFTSNHGLEQISNLMGDRIASRLASGIVYKMAGGDRRVKCR